MQSFAYSVQACNLFQICRLYGACSHRVSSRFRTRDASAISCASLACLSPLYSEHQSTARKLAQRVVTTMAGERCGDRFLRCVMPGARCVVLALKLNLLQRLWRSAVWRYNLLGSPVFTLRSPDAFYSLDWVQPVVHLYSLTGPLKDCPWYNFWSVFRTRQWSEIQDYIKIYAISGNNYDPLDTDNRLPKEHRQFTVCAECGKQAHDC